ncbi:MAG: hypothetical protein ACRDK7_10715 [Solirubrobacteraceae bacterium]
MSGFNTSYWLAMRVDIAGLGVAESLSYRAEKPLRLAQEIRSQIGGLWRAYLPGATYFVKVIERGVKVTRTG